MKAFAHLFEKLDQTTKTNDKVEALASYFREAKDPDKIWAIALLSHRRPKRTVTTAQLRIWAAEMCDLPQWLFEDSYQTVGDLAETIALLLPKPSSPSNQALHLWINQIISWKERDEEEKREEVFETWKQLNTRERLVFNKLITGGFRIDISQKLMTQALARATDKEENQLSHRLIGNWDPQKITFEELILSEDIRDDLSKPYPFYLACALDKLPDELRDINEWQIEQKWDGIRSQIIIRGGELFIWSRGEELITDKFPEYDIFKKLPDGTVIDGEILPYQDGKPMTFNVLQTRVGRKTVTKKIVESAPVVLMAYDLLEYDGEDIRKKPMAERRKLLEELIDKYPCDDKLMISPLVNVDSWEELAKVRDTSRENHVEGIMLKKKNSTYQSGRKKGDWWKWKIDPLTIDAVMIYAQVGDGRRANLYTNYTFAVWDGDRLVPFTKADSGLSDHQFMEISLFVRKNTVERFGPVRSVKPELVFELAFEGINASTRHKSGVTLRFPRMLRWRQDKSANEVNTLDDLKAMLAQYGQ